MNLRTLFQKKTSNKFCFSKIRTWPTNLYCQQYRFKSFTMCCLHMWKDCQNHKNNTQQNPPYVFSALQIPASLPTTPLRYFLTKPHMAEITCLWQRSLGVDRPWL